MPPLDEQIAELSGRLTRYPPQRYPVQHATTQFHLGTALLQADRVPEALAALSTAEQGFAKAGLALERAKAANMRAVGLRTAGRPDQAAEAFSFAVNEFSALGRGLEAAAASYNLGLACGDSGDLAGAGQAFTRAAELFSAAGRGAEAAAAAREHGTLLLTSGEVAAAVEMLEPAVELAFRSGDMAGAGATANALGLAHLAAAQATAAAASFRDALGAHPRSVRPVEHAMAKANLALALERAGDTARSRLAARQALGIGSAPAAVCSQAQQVLQRLPPATGAELFDVLEDTPPDSWVALVREEVLWWADASPTARAGAASAWVEGQLRRPGRGAQFAESLLGALLELPPAAFQVVVKSIVLAAADRSLDDAQAFRAGVRSGMARFALPQWQRLAAAFDAASAELGVAAQWS